MKKVWFVLIAMVLAPSTFAEECGDAVDMADSLDFHKMHVECNEDPVVLYDPKSKSSFFKKKPQAVDTYGDKGESGLPVKAASSGAVLVGESTATETISSSNSAIREPEVTGNAGVVFNIREPFTITGGPQSALNGLYVQMANYCPVGWEKLKEWSVPNQTGYYLHYQFKCAE